nr:acyl-CoA carboxylase subunit beta [Shouchella shacheensis]
MKQRDAIKCLKKKEAALLLGGGEDKQERQRSAGKWTARDRIVHLLDADSFTELHRFVKSEENIPGDGVITGYGTIERRVVCLYAQDFTVHGGTLGGKHAQKIAEVMDLACKINAPIIGLIDSGGARIQEGVEALTGYGQIFRRNVQASGVVPQISVMLGPCAGGAVYSPALTDVVFMVEKTSQLFITGPKVLKSVTGAKVSAEELGGTQIHATKSGVAHVVAATEAKVFAEVKRFLAYLPSAEKGTPSFHEPHPAGETSLADLIPTNGKDVYEVKEIIRALSDQGEWLELQPRFARNLVTGLTQIGGQSVGVIANNPKHLAGCLDLDAADKCARFVRFCDCFCIPLLMLEDVSGFIPGVEQESRGLIRHGAKILYAFAEATVPKITVILRKAYGGAYVALNSKALGADFVYAWPGAEIAVMGPGGAAAILYRKEIEESSEPEKTRKEKQREYEEVHATPYVAAAKGFIDDVIDPRETRTVLLRSFALLTQKVEGNDRKRKHGNMPL